MTGQSTGQIIPPASPLFTQTPPQAHSHPHPTEQPPCPLSPIRAHPGDLVLGPDGEWLYPRSTPPGGCAEGVGSRTTGGGYATDASRSLGGFSDALGEKMNGSPAALRSKKKRLKKAQRTRVRKNSFPFICAQNQKMFWNFSAPSRKGHFRFCNFRPSRGPLRTLSLPLCRTHNTAKWGWEGSIAAPPPLLVHKWRHWTPGPLSHFVDV